ncbi:MAG: hypothetical protein AB7Q97_25630, partial [Gammaproteobacteria bacterium]
PDSQTALLFARGSYAALGSSEDLPINTEEAFQMRVYFTLIVIALLTSAESSAAPPDQELQLRDALQTIADFADRLCQSVPLKTQLEHMELSGAAKAELGGIVKKLGALGISGAGKYSTSESQNVLQKDLAMTLKGTRDCRLQIWNDLKARFEIPERVPVQQSSNPQSQRGIPEAPVVQAASSIPAECSRFADAKMKRRPEIVYPQWVAAVMKMKTERNVYDLQNLMESWGRPYVGQNGNDLVVEATFVLKCMSETKKISVAEGTSQGGWWGVKFRNDTIVFQ